MRRTTLILTIALAVVVVGGGAYLFIQRDTLAWPWSSATTNTVTNQPATTTNTISVNTNTTPTPLPVETKGDTKVDGTLIIGPVSVHFTSQQRQSAIDGFTAEKGQTMLVVYFEPVAPVDGEAVNQGLRDVHITDGVTTYPWKSINVASTQFTNDRGHVSFMVPVAASTLRLAIGTGADAQSFKLQ